MDLIGKGKRTKRQRLNFPIQEEDMAANCLILLARGTPVHVDDATAPMIRDHQGYECKTCFRTFSSFQALGGHRASHKKPRIDENNIKLVLCCDDNNDERGCLFGSGSGKSKVHECGICGAEFASGQALGGHMRRHRPVPVGTNTLAPMAMEPLDQTQPKSQSSVICLDLDLNLPAAPQEHDQDHETESTFLIKSNQQQQQKQLVFPPRTLVDCHY